MTWPWALATLAYVHTVGPGRCVPIEDWTEAVQRIEVSDPGCLLDDLDWEPICGPQRPA